MTQEPNQWAILSSMKLVKLKKNKNGRIICSNGDELDGEIIAIYHEELVARDVFRSALKSPFVKRLLGRRNDLTAILKTINEDIRDIFSLVVKKGL